MSEATGRVQRRWRRGGALIVAGLAILAACSSTSAAEDDPEPPTEAATTLVAASTDVTTPETGPTTPQTELTTPETEPAASVPSDSSAVTTPPPEAQARSFPVAVAEDQRSVVDADGRPWLMVGDAGWSSIVMLDAASQDEYLDGLAAHEFNTVLVNLIENTYSDHPPFDASGRAPFVGDMYRSAPDEEYWAGVDRYVAAAEARGITLLAAPTYLGYVEDGEADNIAAASIDDMASFGSFLGGRYAAAPNIVWVVGGDRTDVGGDVLERLDAFARALRASSDHLITAHTADGSTAADVYGDYDWLQINTSYDVTSEPVASGLTAFEQEPIRPVFSIEGIYEQEREDPLPPGNQLLRYQAYAAVLSGEFGHVFGNNPRWHFGSATALFSYDGTWQQSLDDDGGPLDAGTRHMAVFAKVVGDIPWSTLRPDDGRLITDGRGEGDRAAAAAADPATGWAAVYTVSTERLELDLTVLAATGAQIEVRRVDPASGAVTDLGAMSTATTAQLDHPGHNSNGDDDWLYVLSPTGAN